MQEITSAKCAKILHVILQNVASHNAFSLHHQCIYFCTSCLVFAFYVVLVHWQIANAVLHILWAMFQMVLAKVLVHEPNIVNVSNQTTYLAPIKPTTQQLQVQYMYSTVNEML